MPDAPIFAIPQPLLPISGGGAFPVGRIFCIGRNYAAHAREMGADPSREPPFFFMKPGDAAQPVPAGGAGHAVPTLTGDYQPEVELVVCLGRGGRDVREAEALSLVFGYAVGLDMTRRDVQQVAKDARRPWEAGKSFDASAPVAAIVPASACGHLAAGAISLDVDGATRQRGDLAEMIWGVPALLAELSRWCALKPGDLVMTGTPAGVGPVGSGDTLVGRIAGLPELRLQII